MSQNVPLLEMSGIFFGGLDFFYFGYLGLKVHQIALLYTTNEIPGVITQLQSTASKIFSWFTNNHVKINPGKCHILLSIKNAIDVHLERACITYNS